MMPGAQIPDMENKLELLRQSIASIGKEQAILKLSRQLSLEEVSFLADQLSGRALAGSKFPFLSGKPDIIYPPSFYMEQTSSEATARFKAGLVHGEAIIDMTGGFGIDAYFFSEKIKETWYVEQDPVIYDIASHNFQLLNPAIKAVHADSLQFLEGFDRKADWIYLDPIRRKKDRRLSKVEEFSPNIYEVQDLLFAHGRQIMVKLSPMLDITEAVRMFSNKVSNVYVVAVDNECRELLLISDGVAHASPVIESVNLAKGRQERFVTALSSANSAVPLSHPLTYLYEPNAAIFKAQQYDSLAAEYSLFKLHSNTHLYTSDTLHENFEGRVYRVNGIHPFDGKSFSKTVPGDAFNIKTRNFPVSPAEVAKKLRIKEGGVQYLFCVRDKDEKLRLIGAEKIQHHQLLSG